MHSLAQDHRFGDRARSTLWWCGTAPHKESFFFVLELESLLCNPLISLSEREKAYQMSVRSSATWLIGCWTVSKAKRGLLLHVERTFLEPDVQIHTLGGLLRRKHLHHRGHEQANVYVAEPVAMCHRTKHRLAGHFARFSDDTPIFGMLVCRNLAWSEQFRGGGTRNASTRGVGKLAPSARTAASRGDVMLTHGTWNVWTSENTFLTST